MINKTVKALMTLIAISSLSSLANAASIGVTYEAASIDGTGTETVIDGATRNTNKGTNSKDVNIGSIFVETDTLAYGVRLGFEWIPAAAEFVNKRSTQTNVTSGAGATESKTQVVKGELENHITLYAEKDLFYKFYAKAGVTQVDVKSLESIGTGSTYPDDTITGYVLGIGLRHQADNGVFVKGEYSMNEYNEINLASTNTANQAKGDIESTSFRVSLGYNF